MRTFTPEGTFAAAIDRLAHLVELGVDLVELLPGDTTHGLTAFVDACHARGLGVILDVGYEHVDPHSDDAQQMVLTSIRQWLREHHLDGLRIHLGGRPVNAAATLLFGQLAAEVTVLSVQLGRRLAVIAGSDVDTARLVVPAEPPRAGAPAEREATGDFASLESLAEVLVRRFVDPLAHGAVTTPPAADDQITATISAGLRRVLATLLLTGPAIPIVAMGEPPSAGGCAPLDWSEREQRPHRQLLQLYRHLIALRRQEPQLADACAGEPDVRRGDHFLAVRRGKRVVVANLGRTPRRVTVTGVPRRVLLATELGVSLTHDAVDLPPESAAVVVCRRVDQD